MKKLALLTLVLLSFTNVFAMSENSNTSCEDSVQVSAHQQTDVKSGDQSVPVVQPSGEAKGM
ncbi:hypothetical protein [Bacteriovorax sp. DB6_IX]|uniref:hypothetical protein n=1 Tax=Bacteriovorax sp. DB6_IX TaxID=1353530 RepID=UPI00038A2078|nr:hypothetical protein [Bacteriovorax sp. DB6_IX]EQC50918.1 hypothetical protein M901_0364 [Bacteriovorax sp. DB6_IX]